MNAALHDRVESMLAKPYPTRKDLEEHLRAGTAAGYRAVLVPTSLAELAYEQLENSPLKLACAIGFPFGSSDPDAKRFETEAAVDFGAHEIELVPSIARLIENDYKFVLREIRDIVTAADERPVKVVIESHLWSEDQLASIIEILLDSGAQFLSTSIALQGRHASPEALQHLRELAGPNFGIKVAGLKNLEGAQALISAGADRIGVVV
jgi:deoxyribose-phosphate aldolase